ncbi:helicase-associated domain-containing protein [Kitasatospora sp. NPDC002227]|uniref:helicase-associated domain-containing protein n=1 Tax=Kitasatospora sp. NPDC002227 TaxID=3154773 RepID=UPI003330C286
MSGVAEMTVWLRSRTAGQLAELLAQRGLAPGLAAVPRERLAGQLLSANSVLNGMSSLNLAQLQVLTAVAALADRLHGPVTAASARSGPAGFAGRRLPGRAPAPAAPDPAERPVPHELLLDELGEAAGPVLVQLADRALLLPSPAEQLVLPAVLHQRAAELQGLGHPVAGLLDDVYRTAELRLIAHTLGLPERPTRAEQLRGVVTLLTDAERVRQLAAQAPPEALELLAELVPGPPLLRTHCFVPGNGASYVGAHGSFAFRPGGSGDPGTDWLAARGLLVPVGTDLVELPYEIGLALRGPAAALPFAPMPDALPMRALSSRQAGQAQAAAMAAASRVELLLRAVEATPPGVRKSGGLAVRDTKALAKAAGAGEEQTRLWLDLAANAGLLAPHRPGADGGAAKAKANDVPVRLLPTTGYDAWLAAAPADRLLPLVAAWAVTPEVFSHWPAEAGPPVALVTPQDELAVPLRHALLEVLARLPDGQGLGPVAALPGPALGALMRAVGWHRPLLDLVDEDLDAVTATLAEAELLGVVAEGALTEVGLAVLGLLRSGAAEYFPAVPGAGPELDGLPRLAAAVAGLRAALAASLPAPLHTARFQADLTVVVPGTPGPELAELIGSCADRESDGHAVVWRVGPGSVRRALDGGAEAAGLLARLAEVSEGGAPLPQTLAYLVTDTARTYGRIRVLQPGCCLRSEDPALLVEVSRERGLARLGLRLIAPTVLISATGPAETLAALRGAGYAPVLEAGTGDALLERTPPLRAPNPMPPLLRRGPQLSPATTAPAS